MGETGETGEMGEMGDGVRIAAERISRRRLATRGLNGLRGLEGAALLAGGPALAALASPAQAVAQGGEGELHLAGAAGLELTLATTWEAAAGSGALDRGELRLARRLGAEAELHARELAAALPAVPVRPRPQPRDVPGLNEAGGARSYLELALGLEGQLYLAYLDAIASPLEPEQARLAAEFGASGAQHMALIRARLGLDPAPGAFETGAAG